MSQKRFISLKTEKQTAVGFTDESDGMPLVIWEKLGDTGAEKQKEISTVI